ncbi:MAG: hypothetical protein II800_01605 [Lachnospiraceae bacterium]|nr:hypothetical protein [Lachnospiraceae bacterium]
MANANDEMQVQISENKTFTYPMTLERSDEKDMFRMNVDKNGLEQDRTVRSTNREILELNRKYTYNRESELTEEQRAKLSKELTYTERTTKEKDLFASESRLLVNDTKWWTFWRSSKDSDEMKQVKMTLAALNNLLDEPLTKYAVSEEGGVYQYNYLSEKKMNETFEKAYRAVIEACTAYETAKDPKHATGIRRKAKVLELRKLCENDLSNFRIGTEAFLNNTMTINRDQVATGRDLLSRVRCEDEIGIAEIQKEGNSSNVYKIRLATRDADGNQTGEETYYLKENLALLSRDLPGYLNRRIEELTRSRDLLRQSQEESGDQYRENAKYEMTEDRMRKAGTTLDEYNDAIEFLTTMQRNLQDEQDSLKREAMEQRYIKMFSHDFDEMFKQLDDYNVAQQKAAGTAAFVWTKEDKLAEWQKKYDQQVANQSTLAPITKQTLDELKAERKLAEEKHNKEMEENRTKRAAEGGGEPTLLTGLQWIERAIDAGNGAQDEENRKQALGLDREKDADLIDLISRMQTRGERSVRKFFNTSTGKEAEMFGQVRQRGGSGDDEINAMHNTVYSRIAQKFHFEDVITTSHTQLVNFTHAGARKKREAICTVTVEAKGEEFLDVRKRAEEAGKQVVYTPEAVRQLMRLQSVDTTLLQVDRHGRNFKCETKTLKDGNILITAIKSYDHDQSLGEKLLKDTFALKDGKVQKAGFLPPLINKISPESAMYKYINKKYFAGRKTGLIDYWTREENEPKLYKVYTSLNKNVKAPEYQRAAALMGPILQEIEIELRDDYVKQNEKRMKEEAEKRNIPLEEYKYELHEKDMLDEKREIYNSWTGNETITLLNKKDRKTLSSLLKELENMLYEPAKSVSKRKLKSIAEMDMATRKKLYRIIEQLNPYVKKLNWNGLYDQKFRKKREGADPTINDEVRKTTGGYSGDDLRFGFECIFYHLCGILGTDEDLMEEINREDAKNRNQDADDPLQAGEDGLIEIPAMLHYDAAAWRELNQMKDAFDTGTLEVELKDLKLSDAKINALKSRVYEQIEQVKKMQELVRRFNKARNVSEDRVEGKFFLEKEDYDKITDLSELAIDAGDTYLSIDNDTYLFSDEKYFNATGLNERKNALEADNFARKDVKRMHTTERDKVDDQYSGLKKNVLSSKIIKNTGSAA